MNTFSPSHLCKSSLQSFVVPESNQGTSPCSAYSFLSVFVSLFVLFTGSKLTFLQLLLLSPVPRIDVSLLSITKKSSCNNRAFLKIFTRLLTRALNHPLSFFRQSPQGWHALLNRCVGLHTYGQMGPFSHRFLFASLSLLPLPSILISVPTKKTNNTRHIGGN